MVKRSITEEMRKKLARFLEEQRPAELVNTYLFYVENQFRLKPVLFLRDKMIYQSADNAVALLEKEGKIWRETEIKITLWQAEVNEHTKKIYICPFSGKVFGDNTHPNPQDAIYDWVARCPENKERVGGLPVKRFFVSEDPELIRSYLEKNKPKKEAVTKVVFSSALSGKLFHSKEAVIEDFKQHYLKSLSLFEVQNQNKFKIEEHFLELLQKQLGEAQITGFVEALADYPEFLPYVERWVEAED